MAKQDRHLQFLAGVFRTLGEPTRLRLLMELRDGEMNVTQLCKKLKISQPTVSHHLGILRNATLVSARRNGKEVYYSLSDLQPAKLSRVIRTTIGLAAAQRR